MLSQLHSYLLAHWDQLPGAGSRPKHLSFLGQATGVSKACFFVFADEEPTPCYIVKIPRSPTYNAGLIQEISMIEYLRAAVPNPLRDTLPGPMHTVQLAGQLMIIEPVLSGRPLDSLASPDRPLERATTTAQVALAHRWLMNFQRAAPHQVGLLDTNAVRQHFLEPLETTRRQADLTSAEENYVEQLSQAALALKGQAMPLYLYHGDFRAGNILRDGNRIAVLDWQFSRPSAPPLLDWFSFVFRLYSQAMHLPDIDGVLEAYRTAFRQVFFERNWFSELVTTYTRAYCQALGVLETHVPLLFGLFVATNINQFQAFLGERAKRGYLYLLQKAPTSEQSYRLQLRRQAYVWLLGDLAANPDALALTSPVSAALTGPLPDQHAAVPG